MKQAARESEHLESPRSGLGTLCAEAQADGVPCSFLGKDCDVCEKKIERQKEKPPVINGW